MIQRVMFGRASLATANQIQSLLLITGETCPLFFFFDAQSPRGGFPAAHRGRPDRLLVHVHALLALQTGGELLVRAVGNLFDQLEALFHLTERKDATGRVKPPPH